MSTEAAVPRPEPLLTISEVAGALRVSKMTIYRLVHDGQLPAMRIGKSFRVPASGLDSYLRRLSSGVPDLEVAATAGPSTEG